MIIGLEGLPGAGKTTIVERLPYPYVPEMLVSSEEEATFDESDYIKHDEHKAHLAHAMGRHSICLMDRTPLSFHAYEYALGHINDADLPIPQPDSMHYVYLDIPAQVSAERRIERQWVPSLEFTQSVARFYDHQFDQMGTQVTRIDATQPLEHVVTRVASIIETLRSIER